mgnify:CR=1 FL=1
MTNGLQSSCGPMKTIRMSSKFALIKNPVSFSFKLLKPKIKVVGFKLLLLKWREQRTNVINLNYFTTVFYPAQLRQFPF